MNKERLIKLTEYLYSLDERRFYFGQVIVEEEEECDTDDYPRGGKELDFSCGTVGCAIGHCPNVFPELVKLSAMSSITMPDPDSLTGTANGYIQVASKLFDIPHSQAAALFSPSHAIGGLSETATAREVADSILNFIDKNG